MKKFKVTWYRGSIECPEIPVKDIIKTVEMEAEDITSVYATNILPAHVKENVFYIRRLLWDDKHNTIDYGEHSHFIDIKEVE